jgi:hypothetical protein
VNASPCEQRKRKDTTVDVDIFIVKIVNLFQEYLMQLLQRYGIAVVAVPEK